MLWEAILREFSVELAIGTEERGVDAHTDTYQEKSTPMVSCNWSFPLEVWGFLGKPVVETICHR